MILDHVQGLDNVAMRENLKWRDRKQNSISLCYSAQRRKREKVKGMFLTDTHGAQQMTYFFNRKKTDEKRRKKQIE